MMVDDTLESIAPRIDISTKGSMPWDLTWIVLSILSWCLWRERNQRLKQNKFATKEMVLNQIIGMVAAGFWQNLKSYQGQQMR